MIRKTIVIRFKSGQPSEVFIQRPNGSLERQALAPLTRFTLGSLTKSTAAEMSLQISPWTHEYVAPTIWHLNQAWSLGQDTILGEDLNASIPPGITSFKDITFDYDQAAGTIKWERSTASGQLSFGPSAPGWYLMLKQRNADETKKTAGIKVGEAIVLDY